MDNLTIKQRRFVENYVETGNATQSYIDAGYKASSRNVAEANSSALLANHKVKIAVDKLNKAIESDKIADMIEVKQFWTTIMRNGEIELRDALKASEYIAKTNAAFIEKVEHSGELNISNRAKEIEGKLFGKDG